MRLPAGFSRPLELTPLVRAGNPTLTRGVQPAHKWAEKMNCLSKKFSLGYHAAPSIRGLSRPKQPT